MFSLCANMKWNHLPNAGGLYDQDPGLLEKFTYIFAKVNEHQEQERRRQDRESRRPASNSNLRRAR